VPNQFRHLDRQWVQSYQLQIETKRDSDRSWKPNKEKCPPIGGTHAIPIESSENTNL